MKKEETVDIEQVIAYIMLEASNEDITSIVESIRARRQTISSRAKHSLSVGDTVRVSEPKKKHKDTGEIHKINRTRAGVKLSDKKLWSIPFNMLEKVS